MKKFICEKHPTIEFVWPVHPNPNVKDVVYDSLKNIPQVKLVPPLDYFELLQEMANAKLIWTDSGGIQEEAPFFKKPVLILRNVTERPEVVHAGFGVLVGTNIEKIIIKAKISSEVQQIHKRCCRQYQHVALQLILT